MNLLLAEKLLELFRMKQTATDDEISSQSVILLNKLVLLCEKNIWLFLLTGLYLISRNNGFAEKLKKNEEIKRMIFFFSLHSARHQ